MKTNIILILALGFLSLSASAQNGTAIQYKIVAGGGATGSLKIYCAPEGSRSEMHLVIPAIPGGGITKTMLIKKDNPKLIYDLNEKDKSYKETELKTQMTTIDSPYKVTVIGKEKVGAYACIHVKITQGKDSYDMWTTKAITGYQAFMQYSSSKFMMNSALNKALLAKKADGFPVKVVSTENNMSTTIQLESFKKVALAATIFEIPADYKKITPPPVPPPAPVEAPKTEQKKPTLEERAKQLEGLKKKLPIK